MYSLQSSQWAGISLTVCEIPCLKILEKGRVREIGTEKRQGVGICKISESLCVPKNLVSSHCSEGAVSCLQEFL